MVVQIQSQIQAKKEMDYEDFLFLVKSLDQNDREKIFRAFKEEFAKTMSRTAVYKMSRGEIHLSTYRIVSLMMADERVKAFVLALLRRKAERIMRLVKEAETSEIPKEVLEILKEEEE